SFGDGSGIKVSTNSGGNQLLHHNICFDNKTDGINCDQETCDTGPNRFYNNTLYGNDANGLTLDMAGIDGYPEYAAFVKNNLMAGNNPCCFSSPCCTHNSFTNRDHRPSGSNPIAFIDGVSQSDYNWIADGVFPS